MIKTIEDIMRAREKYDIGVLIFQYLNDIEQDIQNSITASKLSAYYNLKKYKDKRVACPMCHASNPTTLSLNDQTKGFKCFKCGASGTYLYLIQKIENLPTHNGLNEAKIFVANNFANMNLGFNSIDDFKDQLDNKIMQKYNKTHSLNYKDYLDIWLLPDIYRDTTNSKNHTQIYNRNDKLSNIKNPEKSYTVEKLSFFNDNNKMINNPNMNDYYKAVQNAQNSRLISDFTKNRYKLNDSSALYEFMGKKYNIDEQISDQFGVILFKKDISNILYYNDFFIINDRLLYPFTDHETGIVIGFQCRNIRLNSTNRTKYLNVCEYNDELTERDGEVFRSFKSFPISYFLFNLFNIKDKSIHTLWITEGAADCMKLSSMAYDAVSPGQANLSDFQIYLIDKYFGKEIQINIFFDNDSDTNMTGQNKSFINAYKLFKYGFKNIHIVRTYRDIGKDLTDCSVKLLNDDFLKQLLQSWEKESFIFKPASEDDLNTLLETGLYTQNEIYSMDPRFIKSIINFTGFLTNHFDIKKFKSNDIALLSNLYKMPLDSLELLLADKYNNGLINSNNNSIPKTCNSGSNTKNIPPQNTHNIPEEVIRDNEFLESMSYPQLYRLRQKYDDNVIREICLKCNKKQITSIVGKIIKNEKFNLESYLH